MGRQPGEIEALIAVKMMLDASLYEIRGQPGATVTNRTDTDPQASSNPAFIRMRFGEIIDGVDRMNGTVEAAVNGAILGAGVAIWLIAGYLIQRFAFRNPRPTYATVLATSMSASMLLFSLGALLAFHIR